MIVKKIKNVNWTNKKDIRIFANNFFNILNSIKIFLKVFFNKKILLNCFGRFFFFNSRIMIQDLLSNAIGNNLKLSLRK